MAICVPIVPGSWTARLGKMALRAAEATKLVSRFDEVVEAARIYVEAAGDSRAIGAGVYQLIDRAGIVKYVGSTNDFARRSLEHVRDAKKAGLTFKPLFIEHDREARLILEQREIERHGLQNLLNKRNAIGRKNPLNHKIGGGGIRSGP